ncbi:isocitrate lyase/phosphoenolpyruvate mutase family protein [Sulfuriferula sp.]|uniref:isocitrate lyase/phosphoenolpyruvate mutase family protein n=1 Tax=Sulfuriferula sp. TaxID=2025307 RepID=UPI00272F3D66|nr:isocitrate lyase/phosphoenolpyruvate mutase family protein [Sulfuriferula sp.]MDP2026395.1 isocitrate lyase/phosphoenolpyruvate mutase family protein [Sulfuriferula sp.]
MLRSDKYRKFKELHVPGKPLVLYNIWDAGGAKAVAEAGAKAIATSSWSVAAAHGFSDGEEMPLDFVLMIIERIAQSTDLPLTVDFEGGYAEDPLQVAANVGRVIEVHFRTASDPLMTAHDARSMPFQDLYIQNTFKVAG